MLKIQHLYVKLRHHFALGILYNNSAGPKKITQRLKILGRSFPLNLQPSPGPRFFYGPLDARPSTSYLSMKLQDLEVFVPRGYWGFVLSNRVS